MAADFLQSFTAAWSAACCLSLAVGWSDAFLWTKPVLPLLSRLAAGTTALRRSPCDSRRWRNLGEWLPLSRSRYACQALCRICPCINDHSGRRFSL